MAPMLRIRFSGLHAFFPNSPFFEMDDSPGKPAKVTVITPNATRPRPAGFSRGLDEKYQVVRLSHLPALVFNLTDVVRESRGVLDAILSSPESGQELGLLALNGEKIELDFFSGTKGLSYDLTKGTAPLPQPSDERSLWWVPRMSTISRGYMSLAGSANDYELIRDLDAAGLFTIELGRLSVASFHRADDGRIDPWAFDTLAWNGMKYVSSGSPVWNRALANEVILEVPTNSGTESTLVTVKLSDKDGPTRQIDLSTHSSADAIGVRFLNMETEVVATFGSSFPVTDTSVIKFYGDPDFERYYQLNKAGSGAQPLPLVGQEAVGDDVRPCAPVLFHQLTR